MATALFVQAALYKRRQRLRGSVHREAQGLEYENIALYRFVSDHCVQFTEIAEGVDKRDLETDTLEYCCAKNKGDKSMEIYKFFINAHLWQKMQYYCSYALR